MSQEERPRARELGLRIGIFQPGPLNAITDVAGVRVGQTTVIEGETVRTGVTAILPHGGNAYRERVPAALHVGNGFGKLVGVTPEPAYEPVNPRELRGQRGLRFI